LAENAPKARAEFLNVWREDLSDFIPVEVIEACTEFDIYERPRRPGMTYRAFADAAGGTGADSFAFAICHRDGSSRDGIYMLDAVRESKPRFVPAQVITELAQLCKYYGIYEVYGDKYAIGFHESEWRRHGIRFIACEHTTGETYMMLLPLLLAQRVCLINNATGRNQLASLERHVGTTDRESVRHPQHASAHDDVAAAIAGVICVCATRGTYNFESLAS
jgi:hypothetical protein